MKKSFVSPALEITRFELNEEISANLLSLNAEQDGAEFDFGGLNLT